MVFEDRHGEAFFPWLSKRTSGLEIYQGALSSYARHDYGSLATVVDFSMLSEHRHRQAARHFLRRLIDGQGQKPLRLTTDKHPAYKRSIRWIIGRRAQHRQNQYLNNRMEQSHRLVKQHYYPMLGFGSFESASRFCSAFDELRNYLRVNGPNRNRITAAERRTMFRTRWSTLMAELAS